jgi:ElaB/YqjD/DUF883 family membrane-anchored ribosome-binding protein
MSKETRTIRNDLSQLANHARALMSATANVAGEQVDEVRKNLTASLESGKNMTETFREQVRERTNSCDAALHENPYQAIGIALGVGALLGALIIHGRCNCRS